MMFVRVRNQSSQPNSRTCWRQFHTFSLPSESALGVSSLSACDVPTHHMFNIMLGDPDDLRDKLRNMLQRETTRL